MPVRAYGVRAIRGRARSGRVVPRYGADLQDGLVFCWAVLRDPAGKLLAPMLPDLSHTKPGSLLKSQIPIRTWPEWDEAVPGLVKIDPAGHNGSTVPASS